MCYTATLKMPSSYAVIFSSALCTAVLSNKGISVEWGFRWFSPYIKSTVK